MDEAALRGVLTIVVLFSIRGLWNWLTDEQGSEGGVGGESRLAKACRKLGRYCGSIGKQRGGRTLAD